MSDRIHDGRRLPAEDAKFKRDYVSDSFAATEDLLEVLYRLQKLNGSEGHN
jgi:hypothetical protein